MASDLNYEVSVTLMKPKSLRERNEAQFDVLMSRLCKMNRDSVCIISFQNVRIEVGSENWNPYCTYTHDPTILLEGSTNFPSTHRNRGNAANMSAVPWGLSGILPFRQLERRLDLAETHNFKFQMGKVFR